MICPVTPFHSARAVTGVSACYTTYVVSKSSLWQRVRTVSLRQYFQEPLTSGGIAVALLPLLAVGLGYGLHLALICEENTRLSRTVCRLGGTSGGALVETLLYPLWLLPLLVPIGFVLAATGIRRTYRTLHQPAANTAAQTKENIFVPKSLRKRR